jgi:acetoin utilization deacetylase AcuC-like enzyme
LVLVSAGFDAHWLDPLAGLQLTLLGYARLARILDGLAARHSGGRLVFVLEGGYNLAALSGGVTTIVRTLLGEHHIPDTLGPAPLAEPGIDHLIHAAKATHHLP